MSATKIYGYEGNPRTRAVRVVAKYEEVPVELVEVNPMAEGGVGAEYTAKFPLGLIPALEQGDFKLTQTIAIAQFLAQENKAGLLGASKEQAAKVTQWASWANADLLPSLAGWFRPLVGAAPYQKPAVDAAKAKTLKHLDFLEKTLESTTFLAGERVTFADIIVATHLFRGFESVLDAEWRAANPNIVRFWQTVIHQQPFFDVLGNVEPTPVETAIVYTPPKKEAKPKAEAAPKAEKPKAAKPADDEEEEPLAPAEPKAKHPADALPKPTSFAFNDWKVQYSNNDTPVAIKWLDAQVAKPETLQEYSFVRADYKYNDELTKIFMTSNLATGLHTRLEASRKHLFGNMVVYGTDNNSKLIGVYMIRGSNIEDIFSVAPDWESYTFTPLDYNKDHELIEKVWSWEGDVEGLSPADGKTFK